MSTIERADFQVVAYGERPRQEGSNRGATVPVDRHDLLELAQKPAAFFRAESLGFG